ncbi:hypothetical protein [Acidocella aquatica]|uniref:hypothetical protein n=1 Tax=Acidocella aquatica TaxID=1922313 RepID=UPI0024E14376|nr:hypothetical protein [Acidocella aquatica]
MRSGVAGKRSPKEAAARVSTAIGNITSIATESSGSTPEDMLLARAFKALSVFATALASASSSRPASVSTG